MERKPLLSNLLQLDSSCRYSFLFGAYNFWTKATTGFEGTLLRNLQDKKQKLAYFVPETFRIFFFRAHHCQSSLLNDEQAEDKNVFLAEAIQHLPSPPVDANCTLFFRWRGFHGYRLILVVERFLKSFKTT